MLDIFAQYAVDPKLEQEGKWFDIGGGASVLVARSNNATFSRMMTQQYEANKHILDLKDTAEQIAAGKKRSNEIMAYIMAHSILLGWKNLGFKGTLVEYSVANAQSLLEVEQFQTEISTRSNDFKNYRYVVEVADAKNLPAISNGTSPGESNSSISTS